MEWNAIEAAWHSYKGNAQRRWNKLTPTQVESTGGNRAQLCAYVQAAYRVDAAKADAQLADWASRQRTINILEAKPW